MRRTHIATMLLMGACGGGDIGDSAVPDTTQPRDTVFVPTDTNSPYDTSGQVDTAVPDTQPVEDTSNSPEDTSSPADVIPPEDTTADVGTDEDTAPDTSTPEDTSPPEDTAPDVSLPEDTFLPPEDTTPDVSDTSDAGPTDTTSPPVCNPPCANGTCLANNICDCEGVPFTGSRCDQPGCRYTCLNGGVCAPSDCACTTDTVLARFDFEAEPPTSMTNYTPGAGLLADSALVWLTQSDATASVTNPSGNGSAESLSSNAWTSNDSLTMAIMAPSHGALSFAWHQTRSATGPSSFRLEYRIGDTGDFFPLQDVEVAASSWTSTSNSNASKFVLTIYL